VGHGAPARAIVGDESGPEDPGDGDHDEGADGHDPGEGVGDALARGEGDALHTLGEADGGGDVDEGDSAGEGSALQEQGALGFCHAPGQEQACEGAQGAGGDGQGGSQAGWVSGFEFGV